MCVLESKRGQKCCFVRKNSGSIPEWNFQEINITAGWFNSRIEFRSTQIHLRLPNKVLRSSDVELDSDFIITHLGMCDPGLIRYGF